MSGVTFNNELLFALQRVHIPKQLNDDSSNKAWVSSLDLLESEDKWLVQRLDFLITILQFKDLIEYLYHMLFEC